MIGPILDIFLVITFILLLVVFFCDFITLVYIYTRVNAMNKCTDCFDKNGRISELEERVRRLEAQLSQNSRNSSKPPSSDGLQKPTGSQLPMIPGSQRRKSGKKTGGQRGHAGASLEPRKKPDRTERHKVTHCNNCNHDLSGLRSSDTRNCQVFDLPKIQLEVVEHQAEIKACPVCLHTTKADFPLGISGAGLTEYGPNIKSFAGFLQHQHLVPVRRVSEILREVAGQEISIGAIMGWSKIAYDRLSDFERELIDSLLESPVVHFDETGMRCRQKLHWLHCTSTERLTFYGIHEKRGTEAMLAFGILPFFRGIAVHDHWDPYFTFDNCEHALCNSHILRELTFLEEVLNEKWAGRAKRLLLTIRRRVRKARQLGQGALSTCVRIQFFKAYEAVLKQGFRHHESDPDFPRGARGRAKQSKGKNLLDRLRDFNREVLRFMQDFSVPFTNNQGEQDIRMNKVKQKISGCFRSLRGAQYYCRIRSYLSTMRKQGNNLLDAYRAIYLGFPLTLTSEPDAR